MQKTPERTQANLLLNCLSINNNESIFRLKTTLKFV
jgi:hypothetical protein